MVQEAPGVVVLSNLEVAAAFLACVAYLEEEDQGVGTFQEVEALEVVHQNL